MAVEGKSTTNTTKDESFYFLESRRAESFKVWAFKDSETCSVGRMAEAGFYWSGADEDSDSATCFMCEKSLDGWESTDDPWNEHRKHAPQCSFVKLNKAEKDITIEEYLNLIKELAETKLKNKHEKIKRNCEQHAEKLREELIASFKH